MREQGKPELTGHALTDPVCDIYVHLSALSGRIVSPSTAQCRYDALYDQAIRGGHAAVDAVDDAGKYKRWKENITHVSDLEWDRRRREDLLTLIPVIGSRSPGPPGDPAVCSNVERRRTA
jgi:hypothetical protein